MSTNKWQKFCPPIPKSMFSEAQKAQFIDLVQSGSGRALALKEIGLGRQTLQNTLDADPKFAEDYEVAKRVPKEILENSVWSKGLDDGDLGLRVLQRLDNIEFHRAKMRAEKASRDLAASALGGSASSSSPLTREDLKNLTEDELKTLDLLLRKAKQKPKTDDGEGDGADVA
mgnify:CR=1 FL=1